jgi:general secretion pathway protein L
VSLWGAAASTVARGVEDVASLLAHAPDVLHRQSVTRIVERPDGAFEISPARKRGEALQARIVDGELTSPQSKAWRNAIRGRPVELRLDCERFIFKSLDLPRQAASFLEGVVRAQIDRLTPWRAVEAVFGCKAVAERGSDRLNVVVAAARATTIEPTLAAFSALRPSALSVITADESNDATSRNISICERRPGYAERRQRIKSALSATLALALAAAGLSQAASFYFGAQSAAESASLEHRLAERRAAILKERRSVEDVDMAALYARKGTTPANVLVLEALSRTLPDDTYLNELTIDGGKVELAGLTRDAPALVDVIERSHRFSHAVFTGPTTRAESGKGETFQIEARIEGDGVATP